MKRLTKCLVCFLTITTLSATAEINWPRWRGPHNNGSIISGNYPIKWDPENVLWKIDIPDWFPNMHGLKSGPATLPRRLVAVGDKVYATLAVEGPVSEIDAATGEILRVFPASASTDEILVEGDSLYVVATV